MHTILDVVTAVTSLTSFRRLMASLDTQSVPATQFLVVAVPQGLVRTDLEKVRTLAAYRPNLVVTDEHPDWWSAALTASRAGYVLPVSETETVAPEGVARVLEALGMELDAVVARRTVPNLPSDWTVFGPGSPPEREDLARADLDRLAVALRRDLLEGRATPTSVNDVRREALAAATTVEILRGAPLLGGSPASSGGHASPSGRSSVLATGTWSQGALHLELSLPRADEDTFVVLRNLETGSDWHVPVRVDEPSAEVTVDPLTAGAGRPLGRGRWVLDLHDDDDVRTVAWVRSPGSALIGALVVAAVRGPRGRIVLDVGATHRSPLRGMDPALAHIREDARGTRLDWDLPFAHVTGEARLPARVKLGELPVQAELVSGDGRAGLGAWLTGLPSREPVSVALAGSPFHPTGHDLVVAHTGEMEIRRTERAEPDRRAPVPPRPLVRRAMGRVVSRLRPGA